MGGQNKRSVVERRSMIWHQVYVGLEKRPRVARDITSGGAITYRGGRLTPETKASNGQLSKRAVTLEIHSL